MNEEELLEQFQAACVEAFEIIRNSLAPIRTGNLAYNALGYVWLDGGTRFRMYVDEKIAPYMVYTNEVWTSPKWNGKKNPNEGWWEEACRFLAYWIAYRLNGNVKGEIEK